MDERPKGEPAFPPAAVSRTADAVVIVVPRLAAVITRVRERQQVLGHPVPYQTKWQVQQHAGHPRLILRIGWESGEHARIYLPPETHGLLDSVEETDALLLADRVAEQRADGAVLDTPLRIEGVAAYLPAARRHL